MNLSIRKKKKENKNTSKDSGLTKIKLPLFFSGVLNLQWKIFPYRYYDSHNLFILLREK